MTSNEFCEFSLLNGQGGVGLVWDDLDEEVGLRFLTSWLLACCRPGRLCRKNVCVIRRKHACLYTYTYIYYIHTHYTCIIMYAVYIIYCEFMCSYSQFQCVLLPQIHQWMCHHNKQHEKPSTFSSIWFTGILRLILPKRSSNFKGLLLLHLFNQTPAGLVLAKTQGSILSGSVMDS